MTGAMLMESTLNGRLAKYGASNKSKKRRNLFQEFPGGLFFMKRQPSGSTAKDFYYSARIDTMVNWR
jgi:hypothetical protein